jgi:opacity protein-like surface antigen
MLKSFSVAAFVLATLSGAIAQRPVNLLAEDSYIWSISDDQMIGQPASTSNPPPQTTPQTPTQSAPAKPPDQPPWDWASGVSVGLGYTQTTGSPGIGGLNVGAGWRWKDQIELATDMDFGSVTTVLGGINSKSKRQNYLFGGRYYVGRIIRKHSRFEPFGHLLYGWSHESVKTTQGIPITQEITESQTSWAWDFGGGVDYLLSRHWAVRGRVDWVKTHFTNADQSHFKWGAGFWYSFSGRSMPTR